MTTEHFNIDSRRIGQGEPSFLIAEIGQAHDGSLGMAHAFIDAVSKTGADAIKFQTHIAQAESTREDVFRVNFSFEDKNRYDYWQRMEFTPEQWAGLVKHAEEANLVFLSTAFSLEAVQLLAALDMPAWKVGSGDFESDDLMQAKAATGNPILFSTGMSKIAEVADAVTKIKAEKVPFAIFQCTSKYPTPLAEVGLNVLKTYREMFSCPVGLSDHTGTTHPSIAAMAQGADLIEVHVTFDRDMFGPDSKASVTISEMRDIALARDAFHTMADNPVDKDAMSEELSTMRSLFSRSVALNRNMVAGTQLTREMLSGKKPASGIPIQELDKVVGKKLKCDVSAEHLLKWDDLCD